MKHKMSKLQNLILAVGLFFVMMGVILFCHFELDIDTKIPMVPLITIFLGAVIFYISLTFLHWASFFFSGLYIFALSALVIFASAQVLPVTPQQIWPLSLILCSICLILTCLFKDRKLRGVYVFPSVLIFVMGVFFSAFSFGIIKISFSIFISKCFPIILILLGAMLVGIFLYQQTPENKFPYEKDELAGSTDDELPFSGERFE